MLPQWPPAGSVHRCRAPASPFPAESVACSATRGGARRARRVQGLHIRCSDSLGLWPAQRIHQEKPNVWTTFLDGFDGFDGFQVCGPCAYLRLLLRACARSANLDPLILCCQLCLTLWHRLRRTFGQRRSCSPPPATGQLPTTADQAEVSPDSKPSAKRWSSWGLSSAMTMLREISPPAPVHW